MKSAPSSVICFKNGYSFVCVPVTLKVKEDVGDDVVQQTTVGPLPGFVVHGTVGLQPDRPEKVKIFSLSKATAEKNASLTLPSSGQMSLSSIVQASLGKKVTLFIDHSNNGSLVREEEGKIKSFNEEYLILEKEVHRGNQKNKVEQLLAIASIKSILACTNDADDERSGADLLVRYHIKEDTKATAILSYVTRGLTWAPNYSLVIDNISKTVRMEGKACLMCDIAFMDGDVIPEMSLVAGEPNIKNKDVNDPLISGESLSGTESNSDFSGERNYRVRACKSRSMRKMRGSFDDQMRSVEDAEGISGGEAVEDFFHYVLKNVPIKNGHPVSLDFIKPVSGIKYEDVYYINLDKADMDNKGNVEVMHAISYKNISEQPLTSGPVTVLCKTKEEENSKFLVQGLMKFTGVNQDVNVEITTSMDVLSKFSLETKETKMDKKIKWFNVLSTSYTTGEVEIINMKDEDIKCKVEYNLRGSLIKSEPKFKDKVESSRRQYYDLNVVTKYVWEVEVPKKEKKKITFEFSSKETN